MPSSRIIKRSLISLVAASSAYLYYKGSASSLSSPSEILSGGSIDGHEILSQRRIVAVGDLHGDYERTLSALRVASVIDDDGHWSGGRDVLVQTGDITDRGWDMMRIYTLLEKLRLEATEAGGELHTLLGNHDMMQPMHDWRYVHPREMQQYFNGNEDARVKLFSSDGWLGRAWLDKYNTTVNIPHYDSADTTKYDLPTNLSTQFVHAGLHPSFASEHLNDDGKAWLQRLTHNEDWLPQDHALWSPNGPYWYRGAALDDDVKACAVAKQLLTKIGAKRVVQGHTPDFENIVSRCNGSLMLIDTGISRAYGGVVSALEINTYILSKEEKVYRRELVRALYQDGQVTLVDETHAV